MDDLKPATFMKVQESFLQNQLNHQSDHLDMHWVDQELFPHQYDCAKKQRK